MYHYQAIYKPYGLLSQYSNQGKKQGLGAIANLPAGVYPIGRLDADSEGLLLLTNNRRITNKLLDPKQGHWRTYLVQVEGEIDEGALGKLKQPMHIKLKKDYHHTLPARAHKLKTAPTLPLREPPIRYRKNIPTSWIELSLREGKNKQVRKMTAAVGFPTLRLVRWSIEDLSVKGMKAGEIKTLGEDDFFKLLRLRK